MLITVKVGGMGVVPMIIIVGEVGVLLINVGVGKARGGGNGCGYDDESTHSITYTY